MPPNLAFTAACSACEQGRSVEDDADATAVLVRVVGIVVPHLADQVHQKQQRSIADSRQSRSKASVKAFECVLVFDALFDFFPVDAKGRIGKHVVELFRI